MVGAMPRILAAVPEARLVIAGRGEAVPALERQVEALGVGHAVEFAGFVADERKVALYRRARVFVNTSEKEGWGLTVLEANACGAPAVASDSPGLRDAVRHDESGLLVRHADADAYASAILRILQDTDTWRRLRAGALAWARTFSWDRTADETEAVIARVLARPEAAGGG
jgi:glycosyltransferase involved in cell wall biosynthesis